MNLPSDEEIDVLACQDSINGDGFQYGAKWMRSLAEIELNKLREDADNKGHDYEKHDLILENEKLKKQLDIAIINMEITKNQLGYYIPNSGHMYLSAINSAYKNLKTALDEIKELEKEKQIWN